MTVFGHSGGGGGFLAGKQVFPVDYEAEVSQRLLEASHCNDLKAALECIADSFVDVNFVGAVCLKIRKAEVSCDDESANEVRVEYEEFRTDVTPLFLAVHGGNAMLVRKLLSIGADVNQKLFRGFATTAAVREGHLEILEILVKAGSSQPACEEALLEASCHGCARLAGLLMGSDLIRPHVAVHALVTACCRGFKDVVDALIKCGVNANASDRVLLQSYRPSLHTNVDCNALVAAVVSRQISVVRLLLQASVRTDIKVQLGAWSWDTVSGEEFRVGAGLAEPYPITWCAVEYFEHTGTILSMLLQQVSSDATHLGRNLLHHAILCGNAGAVNVLLNCGANVESPVKTTQKTEFHPIHMAARLGHSTVLQCLIDYGCDMNSRTDTGDSALMISAKHKRDECIKVLATAGADFGLVNIAGQSVYSIAGSNQWPLCFQQAVLDVIRAGKVLKSSNVSIFSPLMFVARSGDILALEALIGRPEIDLDYQDDRGFSAVMVTAMEGHVEAFRLLVYAGADVKLCNKSGETAITLSEFNQSRDLFEKVMLEFALEKGNRNGGGFYALHCAARRGDLDAVRLLMHKGYDVNVPDGDGYTPVMLAAREGHGSTSRLLIKSGARCDLKNVKGETALSLARNNGSHDAVQVILDELARKLVLSGAIVMKHTKGGKGAPHSKVIKMMEATGVLRWGNSSRRNVICREIEVGPSLNFKRLRRRKGDADEAGVFRVVTTKNKEVHFVCEGGFETAEMWVRGIQLVTREAVSGKK
ncbi:ankyrin-3-like isoform X3 [Camellia sinensis]|uniref:ankyrin-3-like isoform X1 n=1 Tax=Camellia sinensis TaxID=4442 RepID=UPI001036EA9E|nr:ankyrin-3-like isoform X1 [Camellia sinensis]XP_028084848.1 ankyrin-3-like isoform X2 [Camellia sinensis]XP_028084910.1 ankyrin-3-like isoform X3 [Camellia sinensis]